MSLLASKPFEVTYTSGEKGSVEVRRLSIRQLYQYIELLGGKSTPDLVALCVGQPVSFVDQLSDESFQALASECYAANFLRAVGLAKGDPIASMRLAPFVQGVLAANDAAMSMAGMHGNALSPGPAPSVPVAATGTAA
jgi:hypothetical protein